MQTNHDQGCATASRRGLFVTYLVPTEPERSASGIYRRQRMLTEAMAQTCDEIDILYFVQPHESNPDLRSPARVAELLFGDFSGTLHVEICDRMAPRRASSVWYSYLRPTTGLCRMPGYESFAGRAQVAAFERALARRPDFVLVHRLMCMPPVLRASPPLPPLFLDLDDVEHIAFARSIAHPPRWPGRNLLYLHLPALCLGEMAALRRAHKVFVCSTTDQTRMRRLFRTGKVEVLENALPLPEPGPPGPEPQLLFLGNFGYRPNAQAAEYMLEAIWPLVYSRVPQATLILAGPDPQRVRHHANPPPGVNFPGFVADLDALYRSAAVVVCPVRAGSGTRVKLIEAAGYAKAIVSTTLGAEGLGLRDGDDAILRDEPAAFAQACVDLLIDPLRARGLGLRARETASTRFDRKRAIARLAAWLTGAHASGHRASREYSRPPASA